MIAAIGGFLALVFKFFDPIAKITDKIIDLQIKKSDAKTEQERIASDERIKELQSKRDILVAESGHPINQWIRAALTFPIIVILWKVFIGDKALGQWTGWHTDALSSELWYVVMIVLGFYFLDNTISRWKR